MDNNNIPIGKVPPELKEKIEKTIPGFMPIRQPDRRNNDWRSNNITDLILLYLTIYYSFHRW